MPTINYHRPFSFWIVREEGKWGRILGVYSVIKYPNAEELYDFHRYNPNHFVVKFKTWRNMTCGEKLKWRELNA